LPLQRCSLDASNWVEVDTKTMKQAMIRIQLTLSLQLWGCWGRTWIRTDLLDWMWWVKCCTDQSVSIQTLPNSPSTIHNEGKLGEIVRQSKFLTWTLNEFRERKKMIVTQTDYWGVRATDLKLWHNSTTAINRWCRSKNYRMFIVRSKKVLLRLLLVREQKRDQLVF
jgi:hypothetical protein